MEKEAKRLNALQQKAKGEARKRETRQKIIVGGLVLAYMEKDPSFADRIRDLLAGGVTRAHDREAVAELMGGKEWLSPPSAPEPAPANESTPAPMDFGKVLAGE
jgi:hypothetical protein